MQPDNVFTSLNEPLQRALKEKGYSIPTPIQARAIPHILAGRDLLGCAQTGTGKTAAFTLPLLHRLAATRCKSISRTPRALILAPTRELASQIGESIRDYGLYLRLSHTVLYGGVGLHPQIQRMRRGVDIVVATPGRLLDLMQQGEVRLDRIEAFVLDEADRMLDMGFIPDVKRIISKLPAQRHSLFFSATMPPVVAGLAQELLSRPEHISVDPERPTVERIAQKLMFVDRENKDALLFDLITSHEMDKVLIFTRTKHGADRVVRKLTDAQVNAAAIHGNKSQSNRAAALESFRKGRVRALVATDIAARGIDVDRITHVINYDLPEEPETYVHRIGRTARAGRDGDAFSLCSARERELLRDIERVICDVIPVDAEHSYHSDIARDARGADARPEPRGGQRRPARRPQPGAGRHAMGNDRNKRSRFGQRRSRFASAR